MADIGHNQVAIMKKLWGQRICFKGTSAIHRFTNVESEEGHLRVQCISELGSTDQTSVLKPPNTMHTFLLVICLSCSIKQ